MKIRCLDKETARLVADSEIVRENKDYTITKSVLQKNYQFTKNLERCSKVILQYVDEISIEFYADYDIDSESELSQSNQCKMCFGHSIFEETCLVVESLPARFKN